MGTIYSRFFHQDATGVKPYKVYLFPYPTIYQDPPSRLFIPNTDTQEYAIPWV